MKQQPQEEKKQQLDEIVELLAQDKAGNQKAAFARRFYHRLPFADFDAADTSSLAAVARGLFDFAGQRLRGEVKLRIFNPERSQQGWESSHTVVEIVNDDMPFLVDSVVLALSELEIDVHLVIHPVLPVRRDQGGHWLGLAESDESTSVAESVMHLQIDRQTYPDSLEKIERRIRLALNDVRRAVEDWPAMVQRVHDMAADFNQSHSHLEADAIGELKDFFTWLGDNHFTFLGYREYVIEEREDGRVLTPVSESGLGIMHFSHRESPVRQITDLRRGGLRPSPDEPIIITKTNAGSLVHRGGYMDYISVLYFNADGLVCREKRLIGLFTSTAYIRRCTDTPLVRRKVAQVMEASGLRPGSHAAKALMHILETLPRDELFQATADELLDLATGILDLQERSQTRLFIRRERFGRFFSCLVFIPRDRFNTENREKIQEILRQALNGERLDFAIQVGESKLARVHVIVRPRQGEVVEFDIAQIERRIKRAIRAWIDALTEVLVRAHGEELGLQMVRRFGRAFPASYMEDVLPSVAAYDVVNLTQLKDSDDLRMSLYRPKQGEANHLRFKLFKYGKPIPLSEVMPMLENLGMQILSERPYELRLPMDQRLWVQDFDMLAPEGLEVDLALVREDLQQAFEDTWRGRSENDGFNRLVLLGHLNVRQTTILRACCKYLLQTGTPYSQAYMEQTLAAWPLAARLLVEYFEARFDPQREASDAQTRSAGAEMLRRHCEDLLGDYEDDVLVELLGDAVADRASETPEPDCMPVRRALLRAVDSVSSADQDRILRSFYDLVRSMLRTNAFQQDAQGRWREYLSFKLDSSVVPDLPRPRPYREIWVYSPRVEGIHLRGGKVARGGLRWSDRREDFRTEVLGLLRAQSVKNTMIVPVGAKGGFVAKQLPDGDDRDAIMAEVVYCYRSFINGLLDITDNLDGDRVLPPRSVVRRSDEDDPYLVVAADKGTATFSDIANAISAEHGFWLGDAFASGGSNGYDHKGMGITARGAWESVKRHFRELGLDTQTEPFTVLGIGDMAGDVFGNGMLLSRQIRLKAAFNHQHIFLDPDPDPEVSYNERERLFNLPRSSWADYRPEAISNGGGVFSRQAKTIALSPEIKAWLGVDEDALAPHALIKALFKAPVDLLWNGGIGTYVKGKTETHADVGDLANNLVRVDGAELGCRVVGEGGNLGLTQLGRIEFALAGGRINTDFIDNSAGVDCSDHEVNIKILLNLAVERGLLNETERNELLSDMTDEVASLVLRSNYLQTQALTMMESMTGDRLGSEAHFIAMLERQGVIDRDLEQLPDDEALRERMTRGQGLTRPELSLLLSYGKITLYQELLASDVPEDPYLSRELEDYFPSPLRQRFSELMPEHRLWREIIATKVTNSIVNRMGAGFAMRIREDTGADSATMAKAYTVAREIFEARDFWGQVEALDNQVPAERQNEAVLEMWNLLRQMTRRLIALPGGHKIDISSLVERFAPGLREFEANLSEFVGDDLKERLREREAELLAAGFPAALATRIASLRFMYSALDIVDEARNQELPVSRVAQAYFDLLDRLCLKWLRAQVESLPVERQWHAHARGNLRDELFNTHRLLTRRALQQCQDAPAPVAVWFEQYREETGRVALMLEQMRSANADDYPSMQVAVKGLSQLLHATSP